MTATNTTRTLTPLKLNRERVIAFLRRAIKERGESYVYEQTSVGGPACAYVRDGHASCLVGYVLNYAKPQLLPLIAEWERSDTDNDADDRTLEDPPAYGTGFSELATALSNSGEIEFTSAAYQILQEVQAQQDAGTEWGVALDRAIASAERYADA